MIDWARNKQLLLEGSRNAFLAFMRKHKKDHLSAVGFVFELGNVSPSFEPCADLGKSRAEVESQEDDDRWNSGNFTHPAGVLQTVNELGTAWNSENDRLHEMADDEQATKPIYEGLARISCEVLAKLATEGVFGDWDSVDFNVSEVNDDTSLVKKRDAQIRKLIKTMNKGGR